MFCNKCGTQLTDGQAFCHNCGEAFNPPPIQQPVYQSSAPAQQPVAQQSAAQQPLYQNNAQQPGYGANQYAQQPVAPQVIYQPNAVYEQPMGWFKFLIYFSLFAGAVVNIINGFMVMTGAHYNTDGNDYADLVYEVFPSLKPIDVIFGIVCLALAAFQIYVRFRLAGFYANAPTLITAVYSIVAGASLIYYIATISVINSETGGSVNLDSSTTIVQIAVSIAMIFINYIYFKNRKHMFVN